MKNILVVAAMKMELPPVTGAVATGFGKEKTIKTLNNIFKKYKPSLVISVGVVGAVIPELKAGDIFIPEVIIDYLDTGKRYRVTYQVEKKGVLVTVPKIFKREDKYKLKKIIPDAGCVDMETSAVCEISERENIPLICIKAVSDEFDFNNTGLLNNNIKKAINSYSRYLSNLPLKTLK